MASDSATPTVRVLLVDDDALLRRLLARTLEKIGVEGVVVDGGAAAIDAVSSSPFTLAFIDENLVGERGSEVVAGLRLVTKCRLKCISISASFYGPAPAKPPFDGYDAKPSTAEQLRTLIERWR